jgi:hypothetical protein
MSLGKRLDAKNLAEAVEYIAERRLAQDVT